MTIHTITCLASQTDAETAHAITGPDGGTDVITTGPGDRIAVILEVGDVLGIKLHNVVEGDALEPGDLIVVTGAVGRIPDYQVGLTLTVDADGWAHLVNAGAIAQAISAVRTEFQS